MKARSIYPRNDCYRDHFIAVTVVGPLQPVIRAKITKVLTWPLIRRHLFMLWPRHQSMLIHWAI